MKFRIFISLVLIVTTAQAQVVTGLKLERTLVSARDPLVFYGFSQLEQSSDGRRLFCGWRGSPYPEDASKGKNQQGTIDVWDIKTKRRFRRFKPMYGELTAFGVSRDGKRVAGAFSSGGWRVRSEADAPWPSILGRVCVWDVASGKLIAQWKTPKTRFYSLAFAPDGKSVAAGGGDGTARLWRVGQSNSVWQNRSLGGYVSGLVFTVNSVRLYAMGEKGIFRLLASTGAAEPFPASIEADYGSILAVSPR